MKSAPARTRPVAPATPRAVALAASIAAVLAAAHAPAARAAEPDAGSLLEEVVVTAQKRAESAQEVPISIVALTGESLEKLNQNDVLAIAARTPTLQYSQAGGEAQLYIRGVGSNLLAVGADPSVAIHQDGVYLGRPSMGLNQFLDVERVEILRGPQGTLYGRNATGGTLNLVSKMPTREFEGYAMAGFGENDRIELKGAVGGPLTDVLSFRLAARSVKDDGYTEDLDPRGTNNLDDQDMQAYRGILRIQPSDSFRLDLQYDHSEFENGNTSIIPTDNLGAAPLLGAVPTGSIRKVRNDTPSFTDWKTSGPTATLEWGVHEHAVLTYVYAQRDFEMGFLFNTDGTEAEITRTTTTFDTTQKSHEVRVASRELDRWEWIAGFYSLDEDKFGELGLVRLNLATPGVFIIPAENETRATAFFAQASFELTPTVKLTAGLRRSEEEKKDFNQQINVFTSATNPLDQIQLGLFGNLVRPAAATTRRDSRKWTAFTPKLGLDWKVTDDALVYLSYTKGFKSGGYNDYQPSNPVYEPEFIKSYEVGVKSDWLDRRLRVNAAAFWYDYSDLQVTSFFQSLTLVSNAADSTVKGIDLEVLANPAPGLDVGFSLSWLDATYDSFLFPYGVCRANVINDPSCRGIGLNQPRALDVSGNRLNNAPEIKGNVFAQYTFPLGGAGDLALLAQYSHTDDIYFNAANDPNERQEAYSLLDARIAWTAPSGALEVAAWGKNLTDEDYFHNIVQFTSTSNPPNSPGPGGAITDPFSIGNGLGYPAPGRTWGVDVTYRF
jgi:iron complex outermembrane receptor protein